MRTPEGTGSIPEEKPEVKPHAMHASRIPEESGSVPEEKPEAITAMNTFRIPEGPGSTPGTTSGSKKEQIKVTSLS